MNTVASFLQSRVLPPGDMGTNLQVFLRWIHVVAGITWIGLLYFFNLVSPKAMPRLDDAAREKMLQALLPPTLWWFRWSAVVTVLAGFIYWVLLLNSESPGYEGGHTWFTVGETAGS